MNKLHLWKLTGVLFAGFFSLAISMSVFAGPTFTSFETGFFEDLFKNDSSVRLTKEGNVLIPSGASRAERNSFVQRIRDLMANRDEAAAAAEGKAFDELVSRFPPMASEKGEGPLLDYVEDSDSANFRLREITFGRDTSAAARNHMSVGNEEVNDLLRTLREIPEVKLSNVFRTSPIRTTNLAEYFTNIKPGALLSQSTFTSTSYSREFVKGFRSGGIFSNKVDAKLYIDIIEPQGGKALTVRTDQREVLFEPGASFRVQAVKLLEGPTIGESRVYMLLRSETHFVPGEPTFSMGTGRQIGTAISETDTSVAKNIREALCAP